MYVDPSLHEQGGWLVPMTARRFWFWRIRTSLLATQDECALDAGAIDTRGAGAQLFLFAQDDPNP
jgi:hypothetical protein